MAKCVCKWPANGNTGTMDILAERFRKRRSNARGLKWGGRGEKFKQDGRVVMTVPPEVLGAFHPTKNLGALF